MNNILSIKRLGKLIASDYGLYIRPHRNVLLSGFLFLPAFEILYFLFSGTSVSVGTRHQLIIGIAYFYVFLLPFSAYKGINKKQNGYYFTLLPASSLEKLISMIFWCSIIIPVAIVAGQEAIDAAVTFAIPHYNHGYAAARIYGSTSVLLLLPISVAAIFGNLLFRKSPVFKTIMLFGLIYFSITVSLGIYIVNHVSKNFDGNTYFKELTSGNNQAYEPASKSQMIYLDSLLKTTSDSSGKYDVTIKTTAGYGENGNGRGKNGNDVEIEITDSTGKIKSNIKIGRQGSVITGKTSGGNSYEKEERTVTMKMTEKQLEGFSEKFINNFKDKSGITACIGVCKAIIFFTKYILPLLMLILSYFLIKKRQIV
ncbi:MAG: hypothetical protein LKI53_09060 [Bacteroidales bacterium]|jgi:hypothetical protein|nr:hypothetical protein [Bacteroidales bacterium]